jgi:hypothetical protein
MILIVVSFLLSFSSLAGSATYVIFLAYPFLLVGFPLWTMGRSAQRRLATAPRADTMLNAELKGLNNKYSLHHFVRYGDTWIHHLLVTPDGLIVMQSSDAAGPVSCTGTDKGDRWKSPTNILDRMTGLKPPVGNVTQELDSAVSAVREIATRIGKPEVPIKGLTLFSRNPDVRINGCSFQGAPMSEARDFIRELQNDMVGEREGERDLAALLTSDDRRKLNTFLAPETVKVPAGTAATRR